MSPMDMAPRPQSSSPSNEPGGAAAGTSGFVGAALHDAALQGKASCPAWSGSRMGGGKSHFLCPSCRTAAPPCVSGVTRLSRGSS
eukprot:2401398-Prymnesium_polylepis.1